MSRSDYPFLFMEQLNSRKKETNMDDNIRIPKFAKIGITVIIILLVLIGYWPMKWVIVDAGFRGVAIDKPYFFGEQGTRKETLAPGRHLEWETTTIVPVADTPLRQAVFLDDLTTADNNRVDFHSAVMFSIQDHSDLVSNWTLQFWSRVVDAEYRAIVRQAVRPYNLPQLMGDNVIAAAIDEEITAKLKAFIADRNIRIIIHGVALGQAKPNKAVFDQIEETARLVQENRSLAQQKLNQTERKESERARAEADKMYMNELGISRDQYMAMTLANIQADACKSAKQCFIGIEKIVSPN